MGTAYGQIMELAVWFYFPRLRALTPEGRAGVSVFAGYSCQSAGFYLNPPVKTVTGHGDIAYGEKETLASHHPWWGFWCYLDFSVFSLASVRLLWWICQRGKMQQILHGPLI